MKLDKDINLISDDAHIDLTPLISEVYPIDKAIEAFEKNKEKDVLKVLLKM